MMVVFEMTIGSRISDLRKKMNLTQDGLANKIGISRAALSHYEKDRRDPDYETLVMLADFFEVSTDYLLGHDKKTDKTDEEIRKNIIIEKIKDEFAGADLMFNDLANMTAEQLEEVYDFIKFKLQKGSD